MICLYTLSLLLICLLPQMPPRASREPVVRYDAWDEWFKRVAASITQRVQNANLFGEAKVDGICALIGEMSAEPPREIESKREGTSGYLTGPFNFFDAEFYGTRSWSWFVSDGMLMLDAGVLPKGPVDARSTSHILTVNYFWSKDHMRHIIEQDQRDWGSSGPPYRSDVDPQCTLLGTAACIDRIHRDCRAKYRAGYFSAGVIFELRRRSIENFTMDMLGVEGRRLTTGHVNWIMTTQGVAQLCLGE